MYQQQQPLQFQQQPQMHQQPQVHHHQQGQPIRNRIYVGGIPQTAVQDELRDYFAYFGSIKDARIITDTVGNSKGYGFVTYENEADAAKVLAQREQDFFFKENKLTIGQAFRQNNNNQQGNGGHFNGQMNPNFNRGGFNNQNGFGGGFQRRNNPRFN